MSRLGADPEALDRVARTFRVSSSRLSDVDRALQALLHSTMWEGPDRRAFETKFNGLKGSLSQSSSYLEETSRFLAAQAADQRRASGDDPGALAGGTAATSGSAGNGSTNGAATVVPQPVLDGLAGATDPADVRRRWEALNPQQQAAIIAQHPGLIGNKDGIPPADRIAANHNRIEADARTATGDRKKLLDSWLANATDPVTGQSGPSQVLLYDPKQGHVAVAYGNIATAHDVVVGVPGTGTTASQYRGGNDLGGETSRARDLYQTAHRKSGQDVAVVAWLGYDAPQWDLGNNPGLSGAGVAGGRSLAAFTNGLGLRDDQRLGLVAHSYGAFVAGEGIRDGARPDNVLFLGAPGVGVDSVDELHLPKGADVFAMRAPLDPVGGLQRFGDSPTDPQFGATRLGADNNGTLFSHSQYWTGHNLDQVASAMTDTSVDIQSLPTPGELAGDVVTAPLSAPNHIIDFGQDHLPLPDSVDHAIDVLQRPSEVITGATQTVVSETVDGGAEIAKEGAGKVKEAWDWLTD